MKRGKKHKYMNNNIISLSSCLYSPIHPYPPLSSIHVLFACAHARAEGVKGNEGIVACGTFPCSPPRCPRSHTGEPNHQVQSVQRLTNRTRQGQNRIRKWFLTNALCRRPRVEQSPDKFLLRRVKKSDA